MTWRLFILSVLALVLAPELAYAKRTPAPKVEPMMRGQVRCIAPNDNGRRAYVQAWDTETGRKLWEITIFRTFINPFLEEDVQWVFIRKLSLNGDMLAVVDERNRVYQVDLKTHAVKKVKQVKDESDIPPRREGARP